VARVTTKDSEVLFVGDGPLAQVKRLWNKLELVDRRLFIDHALRPHLTKAFSESGGNLEAAMESLAVRG